MVCYALLVVPVTAEGETSGTEGRGGDTNEGMTDGGEEREPTNWEMVVELVQLSFQDGVIAEEVTYKVVVLIPKGGGDYRGTGLMEVIWKAVAVILNRRLTVAITHHESLHRFRVGRGTGNATL